MNFSSLLSVPFTPIRVQNPLAINLQHHRFLKLRPEMNIKSYKTIGKQIKPRNNSSSLIHKVYSCVRKAAIYLATKTASSSSETRDLLQTLIPKSSDDVVVTSDRVLLSTCSAASSSSSSSENTFVSMGSGSSSSSKSSRFSSCLGLVGGAVSNI